MEIRYDPLKYQFVENKPTEDKITVTMSDGTIYHLTDYLVFGEVDLADLDPKQVEEAKAKGKTTAFICMSHLSDETLGYGFFRMLVQYGNGFARTLKQSLALYYEGKASNFTVNIDEETQNDKK